MELHKSDPLPATTELHKSDPLPATTELHNSDSLPATYIVSSPPEWLCASLNAAHRFAGGAGVSELDRGIVAACGELLLLLVTPVHVVDPRHVGRDEP